MSERKEPGQLAWESAWQGRIPFHPWPTLSSRTKEDWSRVEAACKDVAYEDAAKELDIPDQAIRLGAGEMTAQEMRSVKAVLAWRAAAIRAKIGKSGGLS